MEKIEIESEIQQIKNLISVYFTDNKDDMTSKSALEYGQMMTKVNLSLLNIAKVNFKNKKCAKCKNDVMTNPHIHYLNEGSPLNLKNLGLCKIHVIKYLLDIGYCNTAPIDKICEREGCKYRRVWYTEDVKEVSDKTCFGYLSMSLYCKRHDDAGGYSHIY
jgi:hypothetical protein